MRKKTRSAVMKAVWEKRKATTVVEQPREDMVNHPPHYTSGKYEVIEVLEDWFETEPLLWQVGKYLARWDKKGDPLENLEKAEFYLKRKIAKLKGAK